MINNQICTACNGAGGFLFEVSYYPYYDGVRCEVCKGTGWKPRSLAIVNPNFKIHLN